MSLKFTCRKYHNLS